MMDKAPGCQLLPVYLNSTPAIAVSLSTHPVKGLFLPELWLPGNPIMKANVLVVGLSVKATQKLPCINKKAAV